MTEHNCTERLHKNGGSMVNIMLVKRTVSIKMTDFYCSMFSM